MAAGGGAGGRAVGVAPEGRAIRADRGRRQAVGARHDPMAADWGA